MVSAIIAMAHKLGLSVTAEGIETAEQLAYIKKLHCDYLQGFYFSRPVAPEILNNFLLKPIKRRN